MVKCVGIDLGTTFTVMSYVDDKGAAKVVSACDDNNAVSSVVSFGKRKILVGETAIQRGLTCPENCVSFARRHIAEKFVFKTKDCGEYYPEEILAIILRKLTKDAEGKLGDKIHNVVIAIPVYYSEIQRQATINAARMAGLNCVALITSPSAVAIAYEVEKGIKDDQLVMICDFGGGTFDISIVEIKNKEIDIIATFGDPSLGGIDLDKCIYDYIGKYMKDNKKVDVETYSRARRSLMFQIEKAKIFLSKNKFTEITVYFQNEHFEVILTKEKFEELIESKIDSIISIILNVMDMSKRKYDDIDRIILVGGSAKIPCVSKLIETETGIKPSFDMNMDNTVSLGAAYYAWNLFHKKDE